MTSHLTKRTPFLPVTYDSSKPDTVEPLLDRSDGTNKDLGNSHIFSGIEHIEPSNPVPGYTHRYEQENHFINGLGEDMEKTIDLTAYKNLKMHGEKEHFDILDTTEMAEVEAPLYEVDMSNLTGQLYGLQELPMIDKKKRMKELQDSTRTRDASGDSGATGAGLAHYDHQQRFKKPEESKEEENPYQALAK